MTKNWKLATTAIARRPERPPAPASFAGDAAPPASCGSFFRRGRRRRAAAGSSRGASMPARPRRIGVSRSFRQTTQNTFHQFVADTRETIDRTFDLPRHSRLAPSAVCGTMFGRASTTAKKTTRSSLSSSATDEIARLGRVFETEDEEAREEEEEDDDDDAGGGSRARRRRALRRRALRRRAARLRRRREPDVSRRRRRRGASLRGPAHRGVRREPSSRSFIVGRDRPIERLSRDGQPARRGGWDDGRRDRDERRAAHAAPERVPRRRERAPARVGPARRGRRASDGGRDQGARRDRGGARRSQAL